MLHHAAKAVASLEDRSRISILRQEIRSRQTSRAAADNSSLLSLQLSSLDFLHQSIVTAFRTYQLDAADIDRILIEVAVAFAHTVMRTDGTRDKWKRILLCDHLHGLLILTGSGKL